MVDVRDRIVHGPRYKEIISEELQDESSILIVGEDGDVEGQVDLAEAAVFSAKVSGETDADTTGKPENGTADKRPSRRWAVYKTSVFNSHILPVYTGLQLPSISHSDSTVERTNTTFTADREALWMAIVSGKPLPKPAQLPPSPRDAGTETGVHPWRAPGAFSAFGPVGWKMPPPKASVPLNEERDLTDDDTVDDDDMDLSD